MMQDKQPITSCHQVEAVVVGGDEGTNHYECPVCHQSVNFDGSNPMQDKHIEGIENPKRVYKLEDFVMSDVAAPSNTPVLFVDHGIRIDGQEFISLAKISDLEALVKSEQLAIWNKALELVGEDEDYPKAEVGSNWSSEDYDYAHVRDGFRAELRSAIQQQIDRIGGSK